MSGLRAFCALGAVLIFALTGCDSVSESTPQQASIAAAAERAADLAATDSAGVTECWSPAKHAINSGGSEFRILCRVHFEQAGADRYRDVICVGDRDLAEPVSECYRWAYYTGTPRFEDAEAWTLGRDD